MSIAFVKSIQNIIHSHYKEHVGNMEIVLKRVNYIWSLLLLISFIIIGIITVIMQLVHRIKLACGAFAWYFLIRYKLRVRNKQIECKLVYHENYIKSREVNILFYDKKTNTYSSNTICPICYIKTSLRVIQYKTHSPITDA